MTDRKKRIGVGDLLTGRKPDIRETQADVDRLAPSVRKRGQALFDKMEAMRIELADREDAKQWLELLIEREDRVLASGKAIVDKLGPERFGRILETARLYAADHAADFARGLPPVAPKLFSLYQNIDARFPTEHIESLWRCLENITKVTDGVEALAGDGAELDRLGVTAEQLSDVYFDAVWRAIAALSGESSTRVDETSGPGKISFSLSDIFGELRSAMTLGAQLWEWTYKRDESDDNALAEMRRVMREAEIPPSDWRAMELNALFLAKWAHYAFPRLQTSHTYAAALMCTAVHAEIVTDLVIHWKAFEVEVPTGLLERGGADYNRVRVLVTNDQSRLLIYSRGGGDGRVLHAPTLADLLALPLEAGDDWGRLELMARRLVAGLLLAMQHTDNFREREVRGKRAIGEKRAPPDHRVVFVGAPIKVDARPEVRRFLEGRSARGKTAPPSVQVLVRGHYKRQVMGIGRSGRKVIWVEPYWRGPEDAPILARPRRLGS